MRSLSPIRGLLLGFVGLWVWGCSGPGAETTSAETTSCVDGEEGCACLDGGVCASGLLCASQMCVPGGDSTSGSTTGDTSTTTTSGTTTTTSVGTTGGECTPADGTVNPGCVQMNADTPYCSVSGECVDCSGLAACSSPGAPVCDPESGLCVECTPGDAAACVGTTPVCDAATNACVPCVTHEGCPASACNMLTGECFDEDAVLWVDSGDPKCSPTGGSVEVPLCSLEDAMVQVVSGGGGPAVVRIHKGIYEGPVLLPGGKLVAIVSADPGDPVTITGSADALIEVPAGATLIADGLDLAGNSNGVGIEVTNGQLWLDRTTIHANKGLGITTAMATNARVRSTLITGNSGGGIKAGGGVLRIENSYVTKNGSATSFDGGITVVGGSEVEILYTSVIGNIAILGDPSSLVCTDPGPVEVRNSVIVAEDNESIACAANIEYSAIDVFPGPGSNNMMLMSDALSAYFIELGGVYQAKPGTQLASVAMWKDGDPSADFDGDPRPLIAGPDYAGADVP